MAKPDLVLIHSFPTNSVLLKGLADYMRQFFNVHFIDLPGFNKGVPPLENVSLENYAGFVEKEIYRLDLKSYWLGGVSFGFLVANMVDNDNRCKGFLAIEPFLGVKDLKWPLFKKVFNLLRLHIVILTKSYERLWKSNVLRRIFTKSGHSTETIETMLNTMDPRTFFQTAKLILKQKRMPKLQDKPYVCVLNMDDKTIDSRDVMNEFRKAGKVLFVRTTVEHYPTEMTKDYFENHVAKEEIEKMRVFMEENS